jgi:hypothetical protein
MLRMIFKRNLSIGDTDRIRNKLIVYLVLFVVLIVIGTRTRNPVELLRNFSGFYGETWFSLGYWAAVILLGFALIHYFLQLRRAEELDEFGITIPAVIKDKQVIHNSFYMDFKISYQYLEDRRAEMKLPSQRFYQSRIGDEFEILYLEKRPWVSRIRLDSIPVHPDERLEGLKPTPFQDNHSS